MSSMVKSHKTGKVIKLSCLRYEYMALKRMSVYKQEKLLIMARSHVRATLSGKPFATKRDRFNMILRRMESLSLLYHSESVRDYIEDCCKQMLTC